MSEFVKIATTAEIPMGEMKGFEVAEEKIVVAHTEKGYFALIDECTHDSAPISDGRIRNGELLCKRHGARFDPETGDVLAPPALVPLDTLELKVKGEDILILLDE
ncbi:MAG: Rieske 2Fe-2S domain-containing protein [bacterium]|nr:Rieske 2Fe-2S domain-containing protein [bacterium]